MQQELEELLQFLQLGARLDLKVVSLSNVLSLTGSKEGIELIITSPQLLKLLAQLTTDVSRTVSKDACFAMLNLSANPESALALLDANPTNFEETGLIQLIIKNIVNPDSELADPFISIFSNISRNEKLVERVIDCLLSIHNDNILDQLIACFTRVNFNTKNQHLNYLAAVFSNLSQSSTFRKLVCKQDTRLFQRLLPFVQHEESYIRRGGTIGMLKNICFDTTLHEWLFGAEVDVLPYILLPLAGGEEFDDETNENLPTELQYLDPTKKREEDPDVRIMLLESLSQLCATQAGRVYLREKCAYEILRELHKFEMSDKGDPRALVACENVVDVLIRTEEEIGHDNLKVLAIPDDVMTKIEQMDS
ncbi:unnamed protein product [Diamesa serratosioi]